MHRPQTSLFAADRSFWLGLDQVPSSPARGKSLPSEEGGGQRLNQLPQLTPRVEKNGFHNARIFIEERDMER